MLSRKFRLSWHDSIVAAYGLLTMRIHAIPKLNLLRLVIFNQAFFAGVLFLRDGVVFFYGY